MSKIQELELRLALVSDELINTQAELDNERQYQISVEYLWGLDRELLSNLKEHSENVEHERDEALNQLDSAKHSISVLEKRVLQVTKQRDASLILNKFYKEDRKQRDRLIEVGEAKLANAVEALRDMCAEFRAYDLPYGSKAYLKATTVLNEIDKQ